MKKDFKEKMVLGLTALLLLLFFHCPDSFSWGSATHAYINSQLCNRSKYLLGEVYGGTVPDLFGTLFGVPHLQDFHAQTHDQGMKVWSAAKSKQEKAIAYGFVSHNDLWGADSTAHHDGIPFGQGTGYVIAKAALLAGTLKQVPGFAALGLPDEVTLEISHEMVEYGIDLLIKGLDPSIGQKLSSSALSRKSYFPVLLAGVYAGDFSQTAGISHQAAFRFIVAAEKEFRKKMVFYGQILMQEHATAMHLISEVTAEVSAGFLNAYGITPPPIEAIVPLIEFAIGQSITLCANDFATEIAATIDWVDRSLNSQGISY